MIEYGETNAQGTGASQEISALTIARGISSIEGAPKKVEGARRSLEYLLAQGRPLDSLLLLDKIEAKNLPFNQGERDKILTGILRTAEKLLEKDPIEAWDTVWQITYSKRPSRIDEARDFTREEYERLDAQKFKDQQARTLARFIECYLNPEIEIKGRERFAREDLASHINDATGSLIGLDFDKIFDSLNKETRDKLLAVTWDHPLNVLKSKLQQRLQEAREAKTEVPVDQDVQEGSIHERLRITEENLDSEFSKIRQGVYAYYLSFSRHTFNYLDIPEGIQVSFFIKPSPSSEFMHEEEIRIIGGPGAELNVKELQSLGILAGIVHSVSIFTPKCDDLESREGVGKGHEGEAIRYIPGDYRTSIGRWQPMSMEDLMNYLRTRKDDIEKSKKPAQAVENAGSGQPERHETPTGENVKHFEGKPADFPKFLNEQLEASNQDRRAFSVSPDQVKEYIIAMIKSKVQGGTAKVDEDGNIRIEGIQISRSLGRKVTLDLIMQNMDLGFSPFERKYIVAHVQDHKTGRRLALDKLPRQAQFILTNINTAVDGHLNGMISPENSSWSANDISIEDGKLVVGFEKTTGERTMDWNVGSSGAEPEKTTLQNTEVEPDAEIKVLPIDGKDFRWNRLVRLDINRERSKIVWLQLKIWGVNSIWEEGEFSLEEFMDEGEDILKIPNGTHVTIRVENKGRVLITGGKDAQLSIAELKELKNMEAKIQLSTKESKNWNLFPNSFEKEGGKANFFDLSNSSSGRTGSLSIQEAVDLLKKADKKK